MKFATVRYQDKEHLAFIANDKAHLSDELTMLSLIKQYGSDVTKIKPEELFNKAVVEIAELEFLPPIPRPPRDIICVGKNYAEHALEFQVSTDLNGIPEHPILFGKAFNALIGHKAEIKLPPETQQPDYEAELAVIIGRRIKNIKATDPVDYIWGYSIINDISARDLQVKHKQWFMGKAIDTFCPMGPYIVTADELNFRDINTTCTINGELRQKGNSKDMLFDIPTLIETLTALQTLEAGTIISTGSLGGVGASFDPPKFLKAGDKTAVTIEGIGTLENTVVNA